MRGVRRTLGSITHLRFKFLAGVLMLAATILIYYQFVALPDAHPSAIDTNDTVVYFPQLELPARDVSLVNVRGPLALDEDGCLRLGGPEGQVIVWQHEGYSVDLIDGDVALTDNKRNEPIAFVGDWISLGGIVGYRDVERLMDRQLPDACADVESHVVAGALQPDGIARVPPDPLIMDHFVTDLGYEPRAWFFQREPGVPHNHAGDREGELVLDEHGCLRLDDEHGPVLIWPAHGIEMNTFGRDVMLIRISTGEVIAQVGDIVHVGGEGPIADLTDRVTTVIPEACAADEFWMTGPLYKIDVVE